MLPQYSIPQKEKVDFSTKRCAKARCARWRRQRAFGRWRRVGLLGLHLEKPVSTDTEKNVEFDFEGLGEMINDLGYYNVRIKSLPPSS